MKEPPHSVSAIRERVLERLHQLGLRRRDLPIGIRRGLDAKSWYLRGPSLRSLEEAAEFLRMSVPELLGHPPADRPGPAVDIKSLTAALRISMLAIIEPEDQCPLTSQADVLAEMTARAYEMIQLAAAERPDVAYSDDALYMVASYVRKAAARARSSKS